MLTFKDLKRNLKRDNSHLPTLKVALLGDTATQFLATALQGMAVKCGYNLNLFEAEYNQVERQILDPTSELHEFSADYVVIFQSAHKLCEKYSEIPVESQNIIANERLQFVEQICSLVSNRIIYFNYAEIDDSVFGSFANKVESSFIYQLRKLNVELMNLSQRNPNFFICDIAALQNIFGRNWLFDSSVYVSTEMVLSLDAVPYVASRTMDIICAVQGQLKKCLILDLDNTLWGGIIGDDGLENIQLGHGLGIGKAFSEFQHWIKKLKNRGIILAVCSKNSEDTAREPFLKHPDMVLKLDDISVFIANWETKVDNIRAIQQVLNIGFDSMVFLDDNPFERNMVRENISQICVPELPEDPGDYLEYLYTLNLFETVSYSSADADRTKQYQVEAQRISLQKTFTTEADFLKSLDMISEVRSFDKFNTPRVAQLSQRSNQFNLRTVRYTEADIEQLSKDENYATFSFTLSDKFGDNGLVCVLILRRDAINRVPTLFIDTWFMSCRVLKRGMENFTLNTIVDYARANGFKQIVGEYISTPKNKMVETHYSSLGFEPMNVEGRKLYCLDVAKYTEKECYIEKK